MQGQDSIKPVAIICLGNRHVEMDALGGRVFDHLRRRQRPIDVDVLDGGLCGLDLLRLMERRRRVIFADAVAGFAAPGQIVILDGERVAREAHAYGHGAGLPCLLRLLPQVCPQPLPEVRLVGAAGVADAVLVAAVAERCLAMAGSDRPSFVPAGRLI